MDFQKSPEPKDGNNRFAVDIKVAGITPPQILAARHVAGTRGPLVSIL